METAGLQTRQLTWVCWAAALADLSHAAAPPGTRTSTSLVGLMASVMSPPLCHQSAGLILILQLLPGLRPHLLTPPLCVRRGSLWGTRALLTAGALSSLLPHSVCSPGVKCAPPRSEAAPDTRTWASLGGRMSGAWTMDVQAETCLRLACTLVPHVSTSPSLSG